MNNRVQQGKLLINWNETNEKEKQDTLLFSRDALVTLVLHIIQVNKIGRVIAKNSADTYRTVELSAVSHPLVDGRTWTGVLAFFIADVRRVHLRVH